MPTNTRNLFAFMLRIIAVTLALQVTSRIEPLAVSASHSAPEIAWISQFGTIGPAKDNGEAVAVSDDAIYVAGSVSGTAGTLPGQLTAGASDAFVRKYDPKGLELWTRQFGTLASDGAVAVSVDALGVYVGGTTDAALPGQVTAGSTDAFIRRYDRSGKEVWTRQFGTDAADVIRGLSSNTAAVYAAGETHGIFPGRAGDGESGSGVDAFVRSYSAGGSELWTDQFGSTGTDRAYGVAADLTGIYVAGETAGTLPGQTSAGGTDGFLRKYTFAGDALWTQQFGTAGDERALGVASSRFVPRHDTDTESGTCAACAAAAGAYVVGTTTGNLVEDAARDANAFVMKIVEGARDAPR